MFEITDEQIKAIREDAVAHGKRNDVARCDKALSGDKTARGMLAVLVADGMIGQAARDRIAEIEAAAASDFG